MNIWSLLGVSVAIVATFCIFVIEVFQDKPYYESYKWHACGFLICAGTVLWFIGKHLIKGLRKQSTDEENSADPAFDADASDDQAPQEAPSFLLFSPLYWGPVLVIFGAILIFIVPLSSARQIAAPATNLVQRPKEVALVQPSNPPIVLGETKPAKFPDVKLQGVIFKPNNPSAIINGKAFFIGDYVEEAKITRIQTDSITLQIGEEYRVLILKK